MDASPVTTAPQVAPPARTEPPGRNGEEPLSVVASPVDATPTARPPRFAAFASRNFRLLWFGLLASNVGTWMATTAEHWLATDLVPEQKSLALGAIAFSFAVPMLILPPVGGAIADRVPRLRLLRIAQCIYLTISAALTILMLTGAVEFWMLIVYGFCIASVLAFDNPTRHALLPDLVDRSQLTSAVSLNSSVFSGAALFGPAIAGALIPVVGPGGVFAVNTASYVAVLFALSRVKGVPEHSQRRSEIGVMATIAQGGAYIQQTPLVATLLILSLVNGLLGRSYGPLLAVFARDVFEVGSTAFGFMVAAPGLGTLVGALGLAARGDVARRGRWLLVATLIASGLLFALAIAPWYWLALPLLVMTALFSTLATALTATMLQLAVPATFRGRVMSYYTLTLIGIPALGAMLLGVVAEFAGVRQTFAGAAVLMAILTVAINARRRLVAAAD